jgi:putative peptide zinc metalloprotease protein
MNIVSLSDTYQPQIRGDIMLGPPLCSNGTTVHYLKDCYTNWYYRIGAREYFLVSKMDGNRTLKELGSAYEAAFGCRLNAYSWQQLFALLEKRQLLIDTADPEKLVSLRQQGEQKKRKESRTLLRWRFSLADPNAFLQTILPWFTFMYRPFFVLPALLAFVILEVWVLFNGGAIFASLLESGAIKGVFPIAVLFVIVEWIFAAVHELAHGLTCKRFGGSVHEMGIVWRYLSFFPYTNLDDVVLIHNRYHRVYVAFAGIFVNLLMLLPFAFLWLLLPAHNILRGFSALMLIWGSITILLNFTPFIDLDGYYMLNYSLNMIDLRPQAYRFWLKSLRKFFFKKHEHTPATLDRRSAFIYFIYGLFSICYTIIFIAFAAHFWFTTIGQWNGYSLLWYLLPLVVLLLILPLLTRFRRNVFRHKRSSSSAQS